jgi:diguanylate cyclase (GGDEF)-like protein/PAS domain S-box-containing protein
MSEAATATASVPSSEESRLRAENARLGKMVQALMNRAERSTSVQGSEFSLFQTAVMLEDQIRARTRELEAALHENERITRALHAAKAQLAELLEAEHELRLQHQRAERKFRLIFENAETGIFVIDCDGRLQSWNPALARILGLTATPEQGDQPALGALLHERDGRIGAVIGTALETQAAVAEDLEWIERGRDARWVSLVLNPIEDGLLQGVISDITERKLAESRAKALAERDVLTGLWNRRGLEHHVAVPASAQRVKTGLALLLVDLDGFKQVNDSYGHEAGDAVLRDVAVKLTAAVRHGDIVARLGGDEFVLVLEGVGSPEAAAQVADKLVATLGRPIALAQGRTAHIGGSVGIAFSPDRSEPFDSLLNRADMAMYAAKSAGKSQYRVAVPA